MLHIILLILKILGIILLVLTGILLAVLLLILFVPVRYRISGEYEEKSPRGRAVISWLFHVLSVRLVYEGQAVLTVKVFGFPLLKRQIWPEEEDEDRFREDSEPTTVRMASAGGPEEEVLVEDAEPEPQKETGFQKESGAQAGQETRTGQSPGFPARLASKIHSWFSDRILHIKSAVRNIRRSLKHAGRNIQKARDFWNDEENQKTLRLFIRQTKRLLKHLLPRKVKGRICFGFEDPYYTGQVLAAASPFYGLYAKSLSLEPVFGEKALEGELTIRGYIRLGTLLFIVLRVPANKNFRILLKKWRR